MADDEHPVSAPMTPRAAVIPPEVGTSNIDPAIDREEYIFQLEDQLQELRDTVKRLQQQQETPAAQPQVPLPIFTENMPPPVSMPLPPPEFAPPPGFQQSQYYYPYPPQWYPSPVLQKKECTYKQFLDCRPPEFFGSMDPAVTLNWIRQTVKALDACNCEEVSRVRFATGMLRDNASVWWDALMVGLNKTQRDAITWEQFEGKLCEQYCNPFEMNRIRKEFLDLQMTEQMTVDELIKQFNEKLRFVKSWVPDEPSQVQHFVGALLPEYRGTARLAVSLSQAFTLAKAAEGDIKARDKRERERVVVQKQRQEQSSSQQRTKWQGSQSQIRRLPFGSSSLDSSASTVQRPQWCPRCRAAHAGPCTPQTMRCVQCGEIGHEAKNCRFPNKVCWNCHKEGHRAGECPFDRREGSGIGTGASMTGGSSSASQKRKNPPAPEGRAFQMRVDDATTADDITGMF